MFRDFENDPFFNFKSSPLDGPSVGGGGGQQTPALKGKTKGASESRSERRARRKEERRDRRRGASEPSDQSDALALPGFTFGQNFDQMFDGMNRMMQQMAGRMRDMQDAAGREDFDGHVYSHSSVYTYASNGRDEPQVYQAVAETRAGPGGVRETRKALRDSRAQEEKMAVGHHIGQRGHTVERRRHMRTGQRQEDHHYHGMDEADGGGFDAEWQSRAGFLSHGSEPPCRLGNRRQERRAIDDGRRGP